MWDTDERNTHVPPPLAYDYNIYVGSKEWKDMIKDIAKMHTDYIAQCVIAQDNTKRFDNHVSDSSDSEDDLS